MLGQKSTKLPRFGHSRYSAVGPDTAALRDFAPADDRYGSKAEKLDLSIGVRPKGWTGLGGSFDRLPSVVVLELRGAQVAER